MVDLVTQRKWDQAAPSFDLMSGGGPEKRWLPFKTRLFSQMEGKALFARKQINEAFPLLLDTAQLGFKGSQARVGHIYLAGLGDIEQDTVQGVG